MTHFASYWKFFDDEAPVVYCWRVRGKSRLADARKGDILWLFTSGGKCRTALEDDDLPAGGVEDSQAYLAEVFTVERVISEVAGPFELLVEGDAAKCVGVSPPIPVDDIVRPDGWQADVPIGSLRQGAWRLPADVAEQLQARLRRLSPKEYRVVFG